MNSRFASPLIGKTLNDFLRREHSCTQENHRAREEHDAWSERLLDEGQKQEQEDDGDECGQGL